MKKKIESVKDLLEVRNLLLRRFLKERDKLLELERKTDKPTLEKQQCIDTMNAVDKSLAKVKKIALDKGSFKTENFASFIAALLTFTEKDDYEMVVLNLPDEDDLDGDKTNTYHLVCDKDLGEFVKENVTTEGRLLALQKNVKDRYLAVMDKEETFPLDYYLKVSPQFSTKPQLEEAIFHLVDLGIKNPELSEEERMSKVLRETLFYNISKSNGFKK